ncbi:GCN5 family N-acetyltransferase [Actinoplanes cyaneus]|uniref:GCN5 family N-acetyltransferase n=1 Tax=Actinoplanes cyaneus TaxID=52696 RepID=A0A919IIS7_9ACTN|nr:GNAT family N-acetyltransferase [Actinoplanes cyaneus]MCW2142408.1 Acetyltransferase (GNAT) family protein [Actinoplanes cyaneus]GID65216.1 GCN5 family N-acetyltransferase [Actinoplanes cyaneus]
MAEVRIRRLAESDRNGWEALARGFHGFFGTEVGDDDYGRTWRRLIDGSELRGAGVWTGGEMTGLAHYLFHPGVWRAGRCYLADLFVAPAARRQGLATALIRWVARDGEEHGFPRLYWNTLADAEARALYDTVADVTEHVVYNYRRDS